MVDRNNGPLLFQRYPRLSSIPWVRLATVPTPVQPLHLQHAPGGSDPINAHGSAIRSWVKRDDCTSPVYGGNKIRKLEFLLARAKARRAERLITAGAAGSHHALATAVFGRQLDFAASLVLFPQPMTPHVREVLLTDAALGAELRYAPRMTSVPTALLGARLAHWRERTFTIVPGGSDVTGTLGYVNALLELGTQIDQGELDVPDFIVVAAGTLGTAAGIAIGLALLDLPTRLVATRITSRLVTNERALHGLIRDTCSLLQRHDVPASASGAIARIRLAHDQVGAGYGQSTAAAEEACKVFASAGLALDTTYTAKAAAEFLSLRASQPAATLLFWHTLSATMPPVDLPPESVLPAPFRAYLQRNR
jgi:1-aminocyclopropane-1-carboxylate deaminase/D-cysteine desulfhydrase-like pyridoxal-dependent ACC family enzyme